MNKNSGINNENFDYNTVNTTARIALYDDLMSKPQVTEITPAKTKEFIEKLASETYNQAKEAGGIIPYTIILEVAENFIHAKFKEVIVSILNNGNTIRFADQGPGIKDKEKAQQPGFSSANENMKEYIRGVGSGLPIVKEYLNFTNGKITIEDNMGQGSVVTISSSTTEAKNTSTSETENGNLNNSTNYLTQQQQPNNMQQNQLISQVTQQNWQAATPLPPNQTQLQNNPYAQTIPAPQPYPYPQQQPYQNTQPAYPPYAQTNNVEYPQAAQNQANNNYSINVLPIISKLDEKQREFITLFFHEGVLGVTDLKNLTDTPNATTYQKLQELEQAGLIKKTSSKKRVLTDLGTELAKQI